MFFQKRFLLSVFLTTIFQIGTSVSGANIREELSEIVKNFGKQHNIPCFVAGFVKKNEHSIFEHFTNASDGFADLENKVKCTTNAMMRVASVSKAMSSILVGKYVENGTVNWEDDIHEWMDEKYFPKKTWNNTPVKTNLRQLAMHQSGIRGTIGEDMRHFWEGRIHNTTETCGMFSQDPLAAEPETKYIYSNNGINLMTAVLEQTQNVSFHNLARVFFRTLGLKNAQMDTYEELIPNRATQYRGAADKNGHFHHYHADISDFLRPFPHWPAGGVITDIDDLLTFAQNVLDIYKGRSTFMKTQSLNTMWDHKTKVSEGFSTFHVDGHAIANVSSHYVMAWARHDFPEVPDMPALSHLKMLHHTGAVNGASAVMVIFPDVEFAFCAIANLGGVSGSLPEMAVNAYYQFHNKY